MTKFLKTPVGIFLLGAVLADVLPSIVDPIHFWLINYVFPTITNTTTLVLLQAFDWYLLDASFYFILFIIAWIMHIKKVKSIKIIITIASIIGASVAIGVLSKVLFGW